MTDFGPLPDPAAPLDRAGAAQAFADILDGGASDEAIAHFLIALSDRGETEIEIAEAARALRERLIPIDAPAHAIDVCGTGGDGHHTLNVSTAVSLVVAACGVPVAKHGNRAASSKAGAADTLEALGLDMDRAGQDPDAYIEADLDFHLALALPKRVGLLNGRNRSAYSWWATMRPKDWRVASARYKSNARPTWKS